MRSAIAHLRRLLLRGLLAVLPLVITFWLLAVLFQFVDARLGSLVANLLESVGVEDARAGIWRYLVPFLGMAVVLVLLALIGGLATNFLGSRLLALFERLLLRIPLVRTIYTSAKQLLEAITVGRKGAFREVVAFEYPRRGIWVLGFVSSTMPGRVLTAGDDEMVNIFLPTTPNPTSGFLLVLPARDVRRLPITVEEGIKMIVSGGLMLPPSMVREPVPPPEPRA
ncbi:MAG: DUF502 domain-containing protein [Acidobacteriota bacterium]|jgi:uncharacterized membrane protein